MCLCSFIHPEYTKTHHILYTMIMKFHNKNQGKKKKAMKFIHHLYFHSGEMWFAVESLHEFETSSIGMENTLCSVSRDPGATDAAV